MSKKTKAQLMEELKKLIKSSSKINQEYVKVLEAKAKIEELEWIISSSKMYIEMSKESLRDLKNRK